MYVVIVPCRHHVMLCQADARNGKSVLQGFHNIKYGFKTAYNIHAFKKHVRHIRTPFYQCSFTSIRCSIPSHHRERKLALGS